MIEFRALGALEAVKDGDPLALGAPRQRALLAVLLIRRGTTVSNDELIDALWGERAPPSALKIVQGYVSSLRRALGEDRILTRGRGYELRTEAGETDVDRFELLVAEGHEALERGEPSTAASRLGSALELWRGPALTEFAYESFAQAEIGRLEESRLSALEQRLDAELALGEHGRLVGELQSLVRAHPSRESFAGQLMLALYRCGRQADALECYRTLRERLVEELGLEPSPALRDLERAILGHEPALTPAATQVPPGAPPARPGSGGRRTTVIAGVAVVAVLAAITVVALVGRSSKASAVMVRPNSVIAIDTRSNRVTASVGVGARPGAILAADGSLWVANRDDDDVSQVNPATRQSIRAIPVHDVPYSVAGAAGGVWVAGSVAGSPFASLREINPQFDTVQRRLRIPSVVAGGTASIATVGSSLWVAAEAGELTRIDARTGRVSRRIDPNGGPTAIATGPDGTTWMTDDDADDVIRVDRTGTITDIPIGTDPSAIAVGAGGVWVTNTGDDDLLELDPATGATRATIAVGRAPLGVAVGAGSVWVADSGDGTVRRIDPSTGREVATVHVGGSPQDIVINGRSAWVTTDARVVGTTTGTPRAGTIRVDAPSDEDTLDPALVADPTLGAELLYATCAKLVNYPDRSGAGASQLVPEVAQSLPTRSNGGRTYTFTVRRGFRFSPPSNAPVTAETFRNTIERVLAPRMKSPFASDLLDIVGARSYHDGRSRHLTGVVATGTHLIIKLVAPAPDLPAIMAIPAMCAVPDDTPITPQGVNLIPSAGPYRIASFSPGQGIVLTRNPNYRGRRPHAASRIVVELGVTPARAIAAVKDGAADYALGVSFSPVQASALDARYGPGSPSARAGDQRYYMTASLQLDFFGLNTHRRLFADARLRRAVSEAIDRRALARLGDLYETRPDHPTDLYIPPGIPGYRQTPLSPSRPDVARARSLARPALGKTVVLGTCDVYPCQDQAQIVRRDLRAIGLHVHVDALPPDTLDVEEAGPNSPFDMAWVGWIPDYLDPEAMLGALVATNSVVPALRSPRWRAQLAATSRLAGPRRALAYARLDTRLTHQAAPLIAFGNNSSYDFFSARTGCEKFGPYEVDLAGLCVRDADPSGVAARAP